MVRCGSVSTVRSSRAASSVSTSGSGSSESPNPPGGRRSRPRSIVATACAPTSCRQVTALLERDRSLPLDFRPGLISVPPAIGVPRLDRRLLPERGTATRQPLEPLMAEGAVLHMHDDPGIVLDRQVAVEEAEEFIVVRTSIHDGCLGSASEGRIGRGIDGLSPKIRDLGTVPYTFRQGFVIFPGGAARSRLQRGRHRSGEGDVMSKQGFRPRRRSKDDWMEWALQLPPKSPFIM